MWLNDGDGLNGRNNQYMVMMMMMMMMMMILHPEALCL